MNSNFWFYVKLNSYKEMNGLDWGEQQGILPYIQGVQKVNDNLKALVEQLVNIQKKNIKWP